MRSADYFDNAMTKSLSITGQMHQKTDVTFFVHKIDSKKHGL